MLIGMRTQVMPAAAEPFDQWPELLITVKIAREKKGSLGIFFQQETVNIITPFPEFMPGKNQCNFFACTIAPDYCPLVITVVFFF
jgi:hypothetical protein